MKNFKSAILIVVASITLSGCSDPTIDTSSDESISESSQKVRESLPESQRAEFDEAIQILAFSQLDMSSIFSGETGNIQDKMMDSLNGKTAQEVIAEANKIQLEREIREKTQALEEIQELEQQQLNSQQAREQLKSFEVVRSRFYMREQDFGGDEPIIELTVRNGTSEAVSTAYFEGTIASPERSVPWHKDTFSYSISGGLEPNEEASWTLAPNMFSDWGKVDAPVDAVFTVTVERLDGADGEAIYSTNDFSEYDQERLETLKEKYGVE